MKNSFSIGIIAILLITTIIFGYKTRELSRRLHLIQHRIEESKLSAAKLPPAPEPKPKRSACKARVAIILDDFGYNTKNLKELWSIEEPVTLSILPNLPYSKRIAKAAVKQGCEVMLHLPLEPYEHERLEEGTIMTDMTDSQILDNLKKAMESVPGLKGISNHMGSKATEDPRVISIIFERMYIEDLYFVDSLVTAKSVCSELSRNMGIRFASRSVFLDNEADIDYIKERIKETKEMALRTGWAIGIGHDKPLTIRALKDMLPALEDEGIKTAFVSELAE
ncbi:MAG: divergent polysaccharide deacetylase family protein [Candidatus Omnitrophica bacterium]|nr:divergent polysaccharide deacetylase family protein [Candidatus Omnitrophota bacterium]